MLRANGQVNIVSSVPLVTTVLRQAAERAEDEMLRGHVADQPSPEIKTRGTKTYAV